MKVLVVGGSGFIGSTLCGELKRRDHDVTALSRSPSSEDLPKGVNKVMGNVREYGSIREAFEGMDAVYNLVALSPLFKPSGGDQMHDEIHRKGTEHVVRAAEKHDVDRFVQMSALGADRNGPTHYIRSKGRAEEVVRDSSLSWVIVRPSIVFGDDCEFVKFTKKLKRMFAPGVPLYPLPGGGTQTRFQPIWIGDFAPMLVEMLTGEDHGGQTYEIGGPEVITLREVAESVFAAENRSITIVGLPMPLAGVGLKTLGVLPVFPMGADQYRSLNFDNTVEKNDIGEFGVSEDELTTFDEYLGLA